ncbi:transposase domain-containing protein [Streptomyces europaeiscabiei]|uniref:transposase domain-containing protein n=1 Tax=Streptomyces europaeiscabiei TaxID=146819 RepID=UPI0029B8B76C|nr:transposase domain-containing protein [Streptomyces europaeiscabiei]MDX3697636.1 transposase domain-containing protein [Streptomyces europaeiscabiei]
MLTRWVPPSLVDEVVRAAGRGERRVRLLPARGVVYFVLAMVLFVADSEANVARFRRHAARTTRPAGYPQVRLTALVECGTRALIDAVSGPQQYTEWPQARALLPSLQPGMLLLADRGDDGFEALRDAAATGADVLWRVQAGRLLPVIRPLPDGTHLTLVTDRRSGDRLTRWMRHGRRGPMPAHLTALTLRVISYRVTQTAVPPKNFSALSQCRGTKQCAGD